MSENYYKNFANTEWKGSTGSPRCMRAPKRPDIHLSDTPILAVGIGGTGIEAALAMKDRLEATYCPEEAGKVEYLFIDTDEIPKGKNVKESEKIIIQSTDTAMILREHKLSDSGRDDILPEEISSWLDGLLSPFRVMNGAAGIRQAGRLILFLNIQSICQALEHKISKISKNNDSSKRKVKVYLFAGIGGGTGSGMFIDISYLIRYICQSVELEGVIFMPDVSCLKPCLRTVHKQNIQRNGYAALKELDYLMTLDRFSESFEQRYPGNINVMFNKTPIFDFCILVGAQRDGRNPMGSEADIYKATADYILLEIQERENFGIESYKSNICNMQPRESFCDRYMAIGASSKYIPTDAFYSWWLTDVLGKLCAPTKPGETIKKIFEKDFHKWILQLDDALPRPFPVKFNMQKRIEEAKKHLRIFWTEALMQKTGPFGVEEIYCFLISLTNKSFDDVKLAIRNILEKTSLPKLTLKLWLYYKKKTLRKIYEDMYISVFETRLKEYYYIVKSYLDLHHELIKKMEEYDKTVPKEHYICGKAEFEKMKKSTNYTKSVEEALRILSRDILTAPARWQGTEYRPPKWLSEYVANLLADPFYQSGCVSPDNLIELLADNGYNGQAECLVQILESLHSAQMWPRSATYPRQDDFHNTAAVPDTARIRNWTDEWLQDSGAPDCVTYSKIMDRFVRAILVPGNALYSFHGLARFEDAYIASSNKAGVHIYAGVEKDWNNLPSPYFETKWATGDEKNRKLEHKRNERYREIFDEALRFKIIVYKENAKLYYIISENMDGEDIPVGDITGEKNDPKYIALAKNMFIHMFTHRDSVKRRVGQHLKASVGAAAGADATGNADTTEDTETAVGAEAKANADTTEDAETAAGADTAADADTVAGAHIGDS